MRFESTAQPEVSCSRWSALPPTRFERAQIGQRVGGNAFHLSVPSFAHGSGFNDTFPVKTICRAARALPGRWLAILGVGLTLAVNAGAATAQIDAAGTQQIIRGFGGATVFLPTTPLSGGDLDTLFGNGPGQIGLTLLRIRVASDADWRALELANARGALARGANVIATPWSPPAAMKSNNSLIAGELNASAYADYATYLNDFARYMAANGAPLYAISVQNEPDIDVTYESCVWSPAQMLAFCRNNAGAITATKVIAPESFQFRRAMADPLLNDAAAAANIDLIGGHIYGAGLAAYPLAATKGKEVWMTEHLDLSIDWPGALATAKEIHDCLATANFSAYFWWYLRRFYGPLGEDSLVTKRGYVMAQFSKFIRPGFVRVNATNNPAAGIFVSAYEREKLVIVAINQGAADATQTFAIANATVRTVTSWLTSETASLQVQPAIPVSGGSFTVTLPAASVTTFVGDRVLTAPAIVAAPRSANVAAGSSAVLDVSTTGEFVGYQWSKDNVALRGATNRMLTLSNFAATDAGNYAVTVTNSGGAVTSVAAALGLGSASASRLTNLSTRAQVGAGDNVPIAGFVIGGSAPRPVLVRAAGPVLRASFGLTGALDDPMLEVRDSNTGAVVASNDNWDASLEPVFASVGAFGWTRQSKDAAVLVTLPPGSYTAIVRGRDGGTGLTLVEVYDADPARGPGLINLSTRSFSGTDDNLQIGGFVLSGGGPRTVVIRATGPTLHKLFGVGGTLSDPVIELRGAGRTDANAAADDWDSFLAPHFASVGAFAWPADSRDAAIVTTLEPGAYSVLVRGKASGTGISLIEVYVEP
jgi:glucuronoarabinoxylan endo-1,4-beta-xylanase